MEIKTLFEILASYVDFVVDFILRRGMESYARLDAVSAHLVSYFVVGVSLAYAIAKLQAFPGYQRLIEQQETSQSEPAQNIVTTTQVSLRDESQQLEVAVFVVASLLGALLFHCFLFLYAKVVAPGRLGSAKDTLNAIFAFNAVYHPLAALVMQTQRWLRSVIGAGNRGCAVVGLALLALVIIFYVASPYYLVYALAAVHGTSMGFMAWEGIIFTVVVFSVMALLLKIVGIPLRLLFIRPPRTAAQSAPR